MLKNGCRQELLGVARSEINIIENGPEMAQKLHFFKLSANFSHGYW